MKSMRRSASTPELACNQPLEVTYIQRCLLNFLPAAKACSSSLCRAACSVNDMLQWLFQAPRCLRPHSNGD